MQDKNFWNNKDIQDIEGEIWKDCVGYEGIYSVSNLGRVKRNKRSVKSKSSSFRTIKEKILSQGLLDKNRRSEPICVGFYANNISKHFFVKDLVWNTFNKGEAGYTIQQKDNDITNNALYNLYLIKSIDLMRDHRTIQNRYTVSRDLFSDGIKRCSQCLTIKELNKFPPSKVTFDKKASWCYDCTKLNMRNRRLNEENLEQLRIRILQELTIPIALEIQYLRIHERNTWSQICGTIGLKYPSLRVKTKPNGDGYNSYGKILCDVARTVLNDDNNDDWN